MLKYEVFFKVFSYTFLTWKQFHSIHNFLSYRFCMQSVMLPFYYFSFNGMRKFLMFLKYLFPSNVDQLCIPEIKPQKSFCIFFLWKITAYIIFRLRWFSSSTYHKELRLSPLILCNLTGFVIKALWKPLFYGERPGIVLSVIIHYCYH